jgi:DNA-binding MarR family transcriptional regulator
MATRPKLIFLLNSAQRRLQQWIAVQQAHVVADGLVPPSPAQSGVLFVLAKGDGATMGHLAQTLDLAPSAVSGLIQRMEALGWVLRRPCPEDGRTQRVWLLPDGQAQLPWLKQAMQRINAQLTAGFSDEELTTVARWLNHVQQLDATSPAASSKPQRPD